MKRWIYFLAAGLLIVPLALAHAGGFGHRGFSHHGGHGCGGPGPDSAKMHDGKDMPSMVDHLAKALDLTDDQKASAKEIETKMKATVEPMHADMMRIQDQLDQALKSNAPAAEVGSLSIQAYQMRQKAEAAHADFHTQFQALLTSEQKEKFESLQKEMHFGPHGHHGDPAEMPGK
ncbi:MAG: Spy/CpxP family protein refolding chaperone [Acidobacteriota bacterium]